MNIIQTPLNGLFVAEFPLMKDERGSFSRLFCGQELMPVFGNRQIAQINHSHTVSVGAVRGMHYQLPPFSEMKLVRCIRGKVWDVAVDIREGSDTRFKWFAEELSPENRKMMIIPEGFAHGFQVLEPDSELMYLHTEYYHPPSDRGLNPHDPALSITWPVPVTQLSEKDATRDFVNKDFIGIQI